MNTWNIINDEDAGLHVLVAARCALCHAPLLPPIMQETQTQRDGVYIILVEPHVCARVDVRERRNYEAALAEVRRK